MTSVLQKKSRGFWHRNISHRELALADPLYFMTYYLDMWWLPHRQEFMDFYADPHPNKLHLAPRGHLKTSTMTAYILWRILKNPDITVLIVSNTLELSRKIVDNIRGHLDHNTKLHRDFGRIAAEPWGREAIRVQRPNLLIKEPTVQAAGIGSSILGSHFDLIWMDDIVREENQWTPEQREKVWEWYGGTLQKCKTRTTEWIATGTRKNLDDIYSRFMGFAHWTCRVDKALIDETTGEVLCPFLESFDALLQMRSENPHKFAQEMQNEPYQLEGKELKREWLRYYDPADPPDFNWIYMGVDPAVGKSDLASYTAVVLLGVTPDLRFYVLDLQRHRWHVEWEDNVGALWLRYCAEGRSPLTVAVESVMTMQYVTLPLVEKFPTMPVRFVNYRQKGDTQVKDKIARIRALGIHFMHGRVYLPDPNAYPATITFEKEEYLSFPDKDGYTDLLDALNLAINEAPRSVDEESFWGC